MPRNEARLAHVHAGRFFDLTTVRGDDEIDGYGIGIARLIR
jgi:hypothetical protein